MRPSPERFIFYKYISEGFAEHVQDVIAGCSSGSARLSSCNFYGTVTRTPQRDDIQAIARLSLPGQLFTVYLDNDKTLK